MHKKIALYITIFCLLGIISPYLFAGPAADNKAFDVNGYHTGISPGLELLISQSLLHQKTRETLILLDSEIKKDPSNTTLLYKKASVYADQGQWTKALNVLDQISVRQPNNAAANKLRKIIETKQLAEPHNELGFDVDEAHASHLGANWNYTSVHYYRLTNAGKFGGHINYAQRYRTTGEQYQLEAYPKLSENVFATLTAAYANTTQILYPNFQYMLEGYIDVTNGFEFSLGQGGSKFLKFSNQKIFNYTGTIGKYIGNYFIWFRPHYYTPKSTEFYELGFRKYFSDADNYISFIVGTGRLPDIGDLPPLDQMIIIKQKGIGMNGQFTLTKTVFLKYGVGYVRQSFPSGLTREITDGSIGMVWKL